MQNKNSKLNTILLVILIIIALVCVWKLISQKNGHEGMVRTEVGWVTVPPAPIDQTQATDATAQSEYQPSTTTGAASTTKTFSANGMSVQVPIEGGYIYDTQTASVVGNSAVALNVGLGSKSVLSIYKYTSVQSFNEAATMSEMVLVNSNYPISGTTGMYYEGQDGYQGSTRIVVPSKMTTIDISPASFIGIPQSTLSQIIASITF